MIIQITPFYFRIYSPKMNIFRNIPVEYSFLCMLTEEAAPVGAGAAFTNTLDL